MMLHGPLQESLAGTQWPGCSPMLEGRFCHFQPGTEWLPPPPLPGFQEPPPPQREVTCKLCPRAGWCTSLGAGPYLPCSLPSSHLVGIPSTPRPRPMWSSTQLSLSGSSLEGE